MSDKVEKPGNGFTRFMRKVYTPIGFKKGYNFTLCTYFRPGKTNSLMSNLPGFVFAGALLGFTLARLQYFSINGIFANDAAPGEWYWMHKGFRKVGITLHLATILPAGLLVILQVRI